MHRGCSFCASKENVQWHCMPCLCQHLFEFFALNVLLVLSCSDGDPVEFNSLLSGGDSPRRSPQLSPGEACYLARQCFFTIFFFIKLSELSVMSVFFYTNLGQHLRPHSANAKRVEFEHFFCLRFCSGLRASSPFLFSGHMTRSVL